MNVRYAFAPSNAPIPPQWRALASFPNYTILKNDAALPRALVPTTVHVGTGVGTLKEMAACKDFGSEAWIETFGAVATHQQNGSGRVSIQTRGSRLLLHANMETAGWQSPFESPLRRSRVHRVLSSAR